MKLNPWNFRNLRYTPWKFQCLYLRLVEIPHDFFLMTPWNSLSWPLEFPHFIQKLHVLIYPFPTCMFFSEISHSHSYTDSYISRFWWVVNIPLQKCCTLSKQEILTQKAAFLSLPWTRPIDMWCDMPETLRDTEEI